MIFLISLYTQKPIEFSVFPTILLMTTIYRLAVNIATTRIILTEGSKGHGAAGQIIGTFGDFVIGELGQIDILEQHLTARRCFNPTQNGE